MPVPLPISVRTPRPSAKGWTRGQLSPVAIGLCCSLAVLLSLRTLRHNSLLESWELRHHQGGGDGGAIMSPEIEREAILKRIEAWNQHAETAGLPRLNVKDAGEEAVLEQRKQEVEEQQEAQAASEPKGTCDPPDPDPKYRMRPKEQLASEYPEIVDKLQKLSSNNEILLALANGVMICKNTTICWWNGGDILGSFLTIVDHVGIKNYVIGVMDDETERYLTEKGNTNWFKVNLPIPKIQEHSHPANRVSTMKYTLLQIFIQLGYNTLITDMDLVYLQNPFDHLHRDADVEIQTDGFDDVSYGRIGSVNDRSMGWGGGGLYMTLFSTNVGCMWAKANARTFKLMVQVTEHLLARAGWDQQVFNEYLLQPSHGTAFQSSYVHLRILDINYWVNSKIFFRSRRAKYLPGAHASAPLPVMVHMNYHPDKHKRMLCIMDRYYLNKLDACDSMPGGSEPGT